MLSVFPEVFFLAPFSALILRIALGTMFYYAALQHFKGGGSVLRVFALVEGILALAFIGGIWTQPAAILGGIVIGAWYAFPKLRAVTLGTALLSFALCVSLFLTGAGPFAFDLPL